MSDEKTIYDTAMYYAVELAGGMAALAAKLGVKRQAVYPWVVRGYVPPLRAIQIEKLFGIARQDVMDPRLKAVLGGTANKAAKAGRIQYQPRADQPAIIAETIAEDVSDFV